MIYLDLTLPSLEENLALDEALLLAAEERGAPALLRLWEAPELAVVLGASSRHRDEVHVDLCRSEGIQLARRSSGGGTVLIGPGALNATVVLPLDVAPGLAAVEAAQRFVIERIGASFRAFGPAVEVQGSGDLVLAGRKFAGSAQRRLRRHFLVHISVLYAFPLGQISRYLAMPARQPSYRQQRPHELFLNNLGMPRQWIVESLQTAWFGRVPVAAPAAVPYDLVARLVTEKYGDPAWVERF